MRLVVDVEHAKDLLLKNKQRHIAEFELQTEAWKKAYTDYTDALKAWSQEQPTNEQGTKRPQEPQKPDYYVHDYDGLYRKLNVHVESTIVLDDNYGNDYEQIFENKWNWSGRFGSLSGQYVTSGYIDSATIHNVRNS